jgi:chromosomal replication initiator protein
MARMSEVRNRPPHDTDHSISNRLADRIGQHRFGMWFDHTTRMTVDGERVDVAAESQFVADWIGRHFRRDLEEVARQTLGEGASVGLRVAPEMFSKGTTEAASGTNDAHVDVRSEGGPRARQQAPTRPGGGKGAAARRQQLRRLEEFVVGTSNRLAYQTSLALAEDPETAPPILFVHGECGVGKTHLLQGVIEHRARTTPNQAVRYVTGEEFTNEYIAAVRSGKIDGFRTKIRRLDLLAIDDIHFLSNKNATQNEFLHTLDAIGLGGSSILLASDEHPRQISRFSTALTSRFMAGMVVRIERPELEMREKLVRQLASERGLELTDAAARLLAGRFTGSIRELNGGITKLTALRRLDGTRTDAVGAIMVEQMLEGESASGPRTPVRLGEIIEAVCTRIGVESDELLGRGRHRRVVLARGLVVHLARELTTLSFPEIARGLGRENHSTVHTAARRILRNLQANTPLALPGVGEGSLREFVEQLKYDVVRRSSAR